MSDIFNRPVDNGERLRVDCPFFTGIAGVRRSEAGGEFAFVSTSASMRRPVRGTVDGRAVLIADLRKSDVAAVIFIARFTFDQEA